MTKFTETKKTIDLAQISELERYAGLEFPQEYKDHLLKCNGGRCSPNVYTFIENGKAAKSDVNWFFAIHEGEYSNLKFYVDTYKKKNKRLPSHILPIANDSGGNLICISCGQRDRGQIYFWDHEKEVDYNISDDSDYKNLYFISKSLDEFFNSLKEDFD